MFPVLAPAVKWLQRIPDRIGSGWGTADRDEDGHDAGVRQLQQTALTSWNQYQQTGQLSDISDAVALYQQVLDLTSDNDPDRPQRLENLARVVSKRFRNSGNLDDISTAIELRQQALDLTPSYHADRSGRLASLGVSYEYRFRNTGSMDDISTAINLLQLALELTPDDHAKRAERLVELGLSLKSRFQFTDSMVDISKAIDLEQQALELTPNNYADRARRLTDLGSSFWIRFRHTDSINDISQAIELQQQALELTPDNHPDRALWLCNLGSSFRKHFQHTGNMEDIFKAIHLQQLALELTPNNHADRALRLYNLGSTLGSCFKHTGSMDDISNAIDLQQQALELTHNNALRAQVLGNLGAYYHIRFDHTGSVEDICRAIELEQQALELTINNTDRALILGNLGVSFHIRFDYTGSVKDISKAIELEQQALELTPNNHSNRALRLGNLGSSFYTRYEYTGNMDYISRAIELEQQALDLTPSNHADRAVRLGNLGMVLSIRFRHSGNMNDISRAIELKQQSLALTHHNHADRALKLANLGSSFQICFEHTGSLNDISRAIELLQQALELIPNNHASTAHMLTSLGSSFQKRFECTGDMDDTSRAIDLVQQALDLTPNNHASRASCLLDLGLTFLKASQVPYDLEHCDQAITLLSEAATSISGPALTRLNAAHHWVTCCLILKRPHSVHQAFMCGFEVISQMSALALTIKQRQQNIHLIVEFSRRGFSWALSSKKLDLAMEWIELAQCMSWSLINQLRVSLDALAAVNLPLAQSFHDLSKAMDVAASRLEFHGPYDDRSSIRQHIQREQAAHHHQQLASKWTESLAHIRTLDDFHDFLLPQNNSRILSNLPHNGQVILVVVLPERCDALALAHGREEPLHIPLPDFNLTIAESFHHGMSTLLQGRHSRSQEHSSKQEERAGRPKFKTDNKSASFGLLLGELWKRVVHPILQALGHTVPSSSSSERQRIWWCTTGPLALLPLHAAGIYNQHPTQATTPSPESCISDYAISSYIPTVNTLLDKLKTSKAGSIMPELLLISQPNTPGQMAIPATTTETQLLVDKMTRSKIKTTLVEGELGTVSHITKSIKTHNWVHFACHASQHPTDPLQSGLYLHDGKLSLLNIIRLHIPDAQFAFLSACQTCTGDSTLSDEAFHLAAGMLAAGYRGVVATMWSIRDQYGPDVAADFYDYMLKERKEGQLDCHDAAYALDYAIGRLKEKLRSQSVGHESALLTWVPYVHLGV